MFVCLFEVSGLSEWFGDRLLELSSLPVWATLLVICVIVSLVTEIVGNAMVTAMLMPIMARMVSVSQCFCKVRQYWM